VARANLGQVARRRRNSAFKQASARRSRGAVDGRYQRPLAPTRKRLCQFQIAPRCSVDLHDTRHGLAHRGVQQWQFAALRRIKVVSQSAHCGQLSPRKSAKGLKRAHAKQGAKPFFRALAVKACTSERSQRGARFRH